MTMMTPNERLHEEFEDLNAVVIVGPADVVDVDIADGEAAHRRRPAEDEQGMITLPNEDLPVDRLHDAR